MMNYLLVYRLKFLYDERFLKRINCEVEITMDELVKES